MLKRFARLRVFAMLVMLCPALACRKSQTSTTLPSYNINVTAENAQRLKLQVRQVNPAWRSRDQGNEQSWGAGTPIFETKRTHRDASGKLEWEEDYYYTGRTFSTLDGTSWEFLMVHYDYATSSFSVDYVGQSPVVLALLGTITSNSKTNEILGVADQILKKWGMSRL
jgi:hypothetical protein